MIGLKVFADQLEPYIHWDVDYFEVYIRHIDHVGEPISLKDQLRLLEPIQHKVRGIHGGILYQGVNFCDKNAAYHNQKALDVVFDAVPFFPNCDYIVFHPGVFTNPLSCSFEEFFSWVKPIDDPRFMIEVEPYFGYKERFCFPVYTPQDWLSIKHEINKEIVIDTGHLLIVSRIFNLDPKEYISTMISTLDPCVIHLSNNDARGDGYEDSHLNLVKGSFNLSLIKASLKNRMITIEVARPDMADLEFAQLLVSEKVLSS